MVAELLHIRWIFIHCYNNLAIVARTHVLLFAFRLPSLLPPAPQTNQFIGRCHLHASPPRKGLFSRMQLTLRAIRRTPHGASRLVLTMSCLAGEILTCSVPALWGCEGLSSSDYGHASHEYPPPPHLLHVPMDSRNRWTAIWCRGHAPARRKEEGYQ